MPIFNPSGSGGMSIGGTVTSGTTGSVLFVGASSVLAQDNANFFWNDTTNRLSLGAGSSPDAVLHATAASDSAAGIFGAGALSPTADPFVIRNGSGTPQIMARWVTGMPSTALGWVVLGHASVGGSNVNASRILNIESAVIDPTATRYGVFMQLGPSLTANNSQEVYGFSGGVAPDSSFNYTGNLTGAHGVVQHNGSGTLTSARGLSGLAYNVSTGTIAEALAASCEFQNLNAAGVITNAYGIRTKLGFNNGTLTNTYGVYIGDVTGGTQTNTPYGLYQEDTGARNFFGSPVGFGTATPGTATFVAIAAGTTAKAQINFGASTAPTSPNNGDLWFDGTDVKIRVGGVTKTFTLT